MKVGTDPLFCFKMVKICENCFEMISDTTKLPDDSDEEATIVATDKLVKFLREVQEGAIETREEGILNILSDPE